MSSTRRKKLAEMSTDASRRRLMAVIDVGSTSIRMAIAEVDELGNVRQLENLYQAVNLGKDTFTKGEISKATTEDCVSTLRSFRRVLEEYRIGDPATVRAIATSAVREAANREAFLDRIYSATGINVEAIDEAEVNRFTYLSVQPLFQSRQLDGSLATMIVEVGGGSTEVLVVDSGKVIFSHTYRLGSLRMRQMLEDVRAPEQKIGALLTAHIDRTISQLPRQVPAAGRPQMLVLGGDARFAASQIHPNWGRVDPTVITTAALGKLASKILHHPVDEVVRKYHMAYPDAETLGPALLACERIARALGIKQMLVAGESLREGLLIEMATRGSWSEEFLQQIIHSAHELGKKYAFDQAHAEYVTSLARRLFHELRDEHKLAPRYEYVLTIAGLLHEIGRFVSDTSHHKHSMYLILNSEMFGVGRNDLLLAALVARYHRKAPPSPTHELYPTLGRDERVIVSKLAAILRVADALDAGHAQRIRNLRVTRESDRIVLTAQTSGDLSLEKLALQRKGQMFEQAYGKPAFLLASRKKV